MVVLLTVTHAQRAVAADAGSPGVNRIAHLIEADDSVRIIEDGLRTVTLEVDGSSGWQPGGTLTLTTDPPTWAVPRIVTPSFYLMMSLQHPDPTVMDRLAVFAGRIVKNDDGSLGFVRKSFRSEPLVSGFLLVITLATIAAVWLLRFHSNRVVTEFRPSHLVPALIQTTLFGYWWIYWPGVGQRVPSMVLQIVLAYAADAIISLLKEGRWRIGLGPLPIVLSANLFAWFAPLGATVVVVAAVASRAFIRRDGRHILNPSAAGLTLAGVLSLLSPSFVYEPTFHTLNLAPNMAEVLILLTLVPQIRFRIVLVSVGAVLGLSSFGFVFQHFPALGLPGTLITFALFATDPVTIPRTPTGQLLFGVIVGGGMAVFSTVLTAAGFPDVFSKVFPVPIANALAPWCDALGERPGSVRVSFLEPRWNVAHVALWLCLVVPPVARTKPRQFLMAPHWSYNTPLVRYRTTDALRCEDNYTFCNPFTFRQEISGWVTARQ